MASTSSPSASFALVGRGGTKLCRFNAQALRRFALLASLAAQAGGLSPQLPRMRIRIAIKGSVATIL